MFPPLGAGMDSNLSGWFTERSPMWPGQAFSLKVKKVLLDKQTDFQKLQIFERYRGLLC